MGTALPADRKLPERAVANLAQNRPLRHRFRMMSTMRTESVTRRCALLLCLTLLPATAVAEPAPSVPPAAESARRHGDLKVISMALHVTVNCWANCICGADISAPWYAGMDSSGRDTVRTPCTGPEHGVCHEFAQKLRSGSERGRERDLPLRRSVRSCHRPAQPL